MKAYVPAAALMTRTACLWTVAAVTVLVLAVCAVMSATVFGVVGVLFVLNLIGGHHG